MSFEKLGDICDVIDSLHKTPKYSDIGKPMVRCTDVKYGELNLSNTFKVSDEVFNEFSKRYNPEVNDIIITRVGSYGITAQVKDINFCLGQNTSAIKPKNINPDYLYLVLNSKVVKDQIEFSVVGSTQKTLSLKAINNLDIPRFGDEIENQIAIIGASLDDKIVNNAQTNQTLEQMAQAIFKSWFVDFDPVKAKMNGEQPEGMDAATASLFPEKLVESELGLIPEGWGVGELSKLFELHRGFDLPKSKRQDGEYPVYAAGGYHGTHNEFKMEPPGIITGRSGVIGNVYLSLDKYWPLNTTLYVREFRACGPYYAYHLLRSLDLKSLNSGSAVPSLNRNFVHSTNVCHPDSDVLAKFEEIVTPLFEKMVANNEQNKSLSELRDTLLPKLLSGEIELGQTEEMAEVS
ncbi:restriction endonuclease subunit S [Shewanella psychrotolerans]|uniref:restriction endonuclease subunit S n=1 Tax=Shewanella psychrotolerans TaxID=2864206 RepID=UPI001C656C32|nr:restriction endonuclease subunit S [Shewanella psychrotolerans]QYK02407.1 restriction endonuclease subunit S [Shewanella psychrotolerans]